MTAPAQIPCIGVFDSGVGGLSVLQAMRLRLPSASMLYVADSAHAPYGERPLHEIVDRSIRLTEHLLAHQAQLIVMACNTATAAAVDTLRAQWPSILFVGVEPGIKPAVARSRTGRVGVMATSATIASDRLSRLIRDHAGNATVHRQACPGLADAIEKGAGDDALYELLAPFCRALQAAEVDTVVLGCTHYAFIASHIQHMLGPDVLLIDTTTAVAERVASVLKPNIHADNHGSCSIRLQNTGPIHVMKTIAHRWMNFDGVIESVSI